MPDRVEWPTMAVAVAIWAGFVGVLLAHDHLPPVAVVAGLGVLAAWYGSLQHEVIHGHPTRWPKLNAALACPPLGLVVPFSAYRASHLAHHRTPELTHPLIDPESFYVSVATWDRCGPVRRAALWSLRTLAGRMLLGPIVAAGTCFAELIGGLRTPAGRRRAIGHAVGVAVVLAAVVAAGLPWWQYVLGVAWVGGALALLRSFVEHRCTPDGTRSAVVRAGVLMSLLYLNNNLHHTHHQRPGEAWYRLPALHRRLDSDAAAAAGAGVYRGYTDVARRYLFRAFDAPVISSTASPSPVGSSDAAMPQPAPAV